MVRISGIDLPKSKKIEYALTSVYGIGLNSSRDILSTANVDPTTRTNVLGDTEVMAIREVVEENYKDFVLSITGRFQSALVRASGALALCATSQLSITYQPSGPTQLKQLRRQ